MPVKGPEQVVEAIRVGASPLNEKLLNRTYMRNENDVYESREALVVERQSAWEVGVPKSEINDGERNKKDQGGEKKGRRTDTKKEEKGNEKGKGKQFCVLQMGYFLKVKVRGQDLICQKGVDCRYEH